MPPPLSLQRHETGEKRKSSPNNTETITTTTTPLERDTETLLACWKAMGGTKAYLRKRASDPVSLWRGVTIENGR